MAHQHAPTSGNSAAVVASTNERRMPVIVQMPKPQLSIEVGHSSFMQSPSFLHSHMLRQLALGLNSQTLISTPASPSPGYFIPILSDDLWRLLPTPAQPSLASIAAAAAAVR